MFLHFSKPESTKARTQRTLTQAPRSAFPENAPSRAEWRLGFWEAFVKFAVSSQPVAKSYKLCVFSFLIYFLLSAKLLRLPPKLDKANFILPPQGNWFPPPAAWCQQNLFAPAFLTRRSQNQEWKIKSMLRQIYLFGWRHFLKACLLAFGQCSRLKRLVNSALKQCYASLTLHKIYPNLFFLDQISRASCAAFFR